MPVYALTSWISVLTLFHILTNILTAKLEFLQVGWVWNSVCVCESACVCLCNHLTVVLILTFLPVLMFVFELAFMDLLSVFLF